MWDDQELRVYNGSLALACRPEQNTQPKKIMNSRLTKRRPHFSGVFSVQRMLGALQ